MEDYREITTRLPKDLALWLREFSHKSGLSQRELITKAVTNLKELYTLS